MKNRLNDFIRFKDRVDCYIRQIDSLKYDYTGMMLLADEARLFINSSCDWLDICDSDRLDLITKIDEAVKSARIR